MASSRMTALPALLAMAGYQAGIALAKSLVTSPGKDPARRRSRMKADSAICSVACSGSD
jgi:hypothetical protein